MSPFAPRRWPCSSRWGSDPNESLCAETVAVNQTLQETHLSSNSCFFPHLCVDRLQRQHGLGGFAQPCHRPGGRSAQLRRQTGELHRHCDAVEREDRWLVLGGRGAMGGLRAQRKGPWVMNTSRESRPEFDLSGQSGAAVTTRTNVAL